MIWRISIWLPAAPTLIALAMPVMTISAAGVEDGWNNLRHVTKDRAYTVIFRDGHCAHGALVSVNAQSAVLSNASGGTLVINRAEVLRVSDTPSAPIHDAIFSGRSSWIDVKEAAPRGDQYLDIIASSAEEWKWKQPRVLNDSVLFDGKAAARTDIRYVSDVRYKPLTRTEEFVHHENVDLLAPRLWFHAVMLGKISILLYRSDAPEDNSPLECR